MRRNLYLAECVAIALLGPGGGEGGGGGISDLDAGDDAGVIDSGTPDSGEADAGQADGGEPDAGDGDAGAPDSGQPDSGVNRPPVLNDPGTVGIDEGLSRTIAWIEANASSFRLGDYVI